ncbi:MAG: branched-chain amino acid ABC transporter permease [Acidimicrobiia bacterium]
MRVTQLIVFGLGTGAFLLISTFGFALVRRVEGFLNIAHAELMSVAAFTTWYLNVSLGWHFLLAAALALVLTALVALLIARLVYDPIKHLGPAILLITSVGVAFVLHGITEAFIGVGIRSFEIPRLDALSVAGVFVAPYRLVLLAIAAVITVGLALFLSKTRIGKSIRAMSINRDLAASRGVDIVAASRSTWLVAGLLAGLGGVALGVLGTLTTDIAFEQILVILAVAIVAGLGSLYGVILAAFIVGLAMDLSVLFLPGGYRPVIAFAIVILVLVVRPRGVAGSVERAA